MIKKKSKPVQLPLRQRKKDNRAGRKEGKKADSGGLRFANFLASRARRPEFKEREREREVCGLVQIFGTD